MGAWKRWVPGVVAAIAIATSLFFVDWWSVGEGIVQVVRPTGVRLCLDGDCRGGVPLRAIDGTWAALTQLTLILGIACTALVGYVSVMRAVTGASSPFERVVPWMMSSLLILVVLSVMTFPTTTEGMQLGPILCALGAGVGMWSASAARAGDDVFGEGRAGAPLKVAPVRATVAATRAATATTTPTAAGHVAASIAPPSIAAVAAVALEAERGALRFVAVDGELDDDGVRVRMADGGERVVRWADVLRVVARRMPPDPPHEKVGFMDLVVRDAAPVRLMPSTRLDYNALPGGAAPNTRENWRKLAAHACARNPAIEIEAESAPFFAGGRDAPMFAALKLFAAYDAQYR